MIFSLQSSTEETQRGFKTPGLYLRSPSPETYSVSGSPVGMAAFIGYARLREGAEDPAHPTSQWPVEISSYDEAVQRLEVPAWGLLLPSLALYFLNGGRRCRVVGLEPDGPHRPETLIPSDPERGFGLPALDRVGMPELLLAPDLFVLPPGTSAPSLEHFVQLQHTLIDAAAGQLPSSELSSGLALLDLPPRLTPTQTVTYLSLLKLHPLASFGACYGPWVQILDPRADATCPRGVRAPLEGPALQLLPPTPALAGILATRSIPPLESGQAVVTADFGPHQSPANRRIEGLFGLEQQASGSGREELLRASLNLLISRSGDGFRLWGDRTLSSELGLRHCTVRRVLTFIQRSIYLSSRWAVFEPNTWTLWLQLTAQVEIFLESLYNAGVIVGASPDDAFFVKCDSDTNPPAAVEAGQITMQIFVRPARSTEVMVVEVRHRSALPGSTRQGGG